MDIVSYAGTEKDVKYECQCTYCDKIVMRNRKSKVVTCFDCKTKANRDRTRKYFGVVVE